MECNHKETLRQIAQYIRLYPLEGAVDLDYRLGMLEQNGHMYLEFRRAIDEKTFVDATLYVECEKSYYQWSGAELVDEEGNVFVERHVITSVNHPCYGSRTPAQTRAFAELLECVAVLAEDITNLFNKPVRILLRTAEEDRALRQEEEKRRVQREVDDFRAKNALQMRVNSVKVFPKTHDIPVGTYESEFTYKKPGVPGKFCRTYTVTATETQLILQRTL